MRRTQRSIPILLLLAFCLPWMASAAPKVVHRGPHGKTVVHRGPRGKVVVHHGFPITRTLPRVYVRAPRVAIRVTPRAFLPRRIFPATVIKVRPAPAAIVWHEVEPFALDDGWTEASLVVTHTGRHLYFEIAEAPVSVSFAEVVYDDGETQVVDFNDRTYQPGYYGLLDLDTARGIDHVRLVASATRADVQIGLHLTM